MPARYWLGALGLIVAMLGASMWYQQSAPEPAPLIVDSAGSVEASVITVHVSGQVGAPGLVEVDSAARVADAVAAAGGTTRDADLSRINLAAALQDGQQIVIPGVDELGSAGAATADGKIRINSASATELEQLPGVGPVLAARIAAYRDENGPFAVVEDLLDVSGIGEGKLETLRDSVALP